MIMLTVRNLPDEVHRALRVLVALHGHSMEAYVSVISELLRDTPAPQVIE